MHVQKRGKKKERKEKEKKFFLLSPRVPADRFSLSPRFFVSSSRRRLLFPSIFLRALVRSSAAITLAPPPFVFTAVGCLSSVRSSHYRYPQSEPRSRDSLRSANSRLFCRRRSIVRLHPPLVRRRRCNGGTFLLSEFILGKN